MAVAEDLYDEELTLFEENFKEINILELKICKLYTAKLLSQNITQNHQQEIAQAEGEIIEVLGRTTIQSCMKKLKVLAVALEQLTSFLDYR